MEIMSDMTRQTAGGRHINIPIFVPHMGCPNTCVFCDQRSISGSAAPASADDVRETIGKYLAGSSGEDHAEIAFFGGSFTGIPRCQMTSYLGVAREYIEKGLAEGIRISTRPDYIDQEVLEILKEYGVRVIELGVQSMDDEVLAMSKRGHTAEDVVKAAEQIKAQGFELGIQIMPGLPGDTLEKSVNTAKKVVDLGPSQVRIYPAIVLKGTEMEEMYRNGSYTPLTLDEAVEWCAIMVPMFTKAGIRIIRLGLHYSELLESSVVAGPFHPAFGELVESRVMLDRIAGIIEEKGLKGCPGIEIHTWKGALSKTVGHQRANIKALKERYGYARIRVGERDLQPGHIRVYALYGGDRQ